MNALLTFVNDSDFRVSGRVRTWTPPRWFRLWMRGATRVADRWLWPALALVLGAAGHAGHEALLAGAAAALVANVLLVTLKRRVRRRRPCDEAPHPLFRDLTPPDPFSFPSGHSMNAFAVCTVLALQFPVAAPALALLAGSIAASRVVLGMHYVSDVIVGSLLGAALGAASFALLV
jgi:undecaprenyl-diphosphatase